MRIEYYHASVYGNGTKVAEEFRRQMSEKGNEVVVHHVKEALDGQLPPADLYLFSSPVRMGKPIKEMRRFLEKMTLPNGTKYVVLTTELSPRPDKTGKVPDADNCRWQRVRPIMNELLQAKGLIRLAENKIYVVDTEGPLEGGWQQKVEALVAEICGVGAGRVAP